MSPAATYALVTFLAGAALLLAWIYATTENVRSGAILRKSLWLFVLPMVLAPTQLLTFPLAMLFWVICEEGLKAFASTREEEPINRFWLVSLFGIWELMISKPFWGLVLAREHADLSRPELLFLVYGTSLPALMHAVTACIYAFRFSRGSWLALVTCCILHASWNAIAPRYVFSWPVEIIETMILATLLLAVWPKHVRLSDGLDTQPTP